jgi:flagellar basal body-associated protein FliL
MSQPPYPPYGQPEPDPQGGGYQPPSYPPPARPSSGGSYQGGGYQPGPPPGQGGYPPPAPHEQGGYHPDQGGYQAAPPPPGGGYPGQPGQPYGAPPKKKGGALKIILIVLGVVVLLCVAGVAVAVYKGKGKVEDVVAASKISVVEPATLGGRKKVSDPSLQSSVQSLDSEMKNIQGTTSSVGAIYGDLAKKDVVMVAAASTLTGTAQTRYDEFTSGLDTGGFSTSALKDTEPGPLGGIAKCGDSSVSGVPTAVCVWSDQGSVGMIMMLFKKKADLEKEFVSYRGQIEKKA